MVPDREEWGHKDGAQAVVAGLRDHGYAIFDLGPEALELCDAAVADVEPLILASDAGRAQDAWRRSAAVRALALQPRVLDMLQQAYGREPFAFQTLNFRVGTGQEIHTDTVHFNSRPEGFMCGVWIALEDIAAEAGPLRYYPGSHLLPRITMADAGVIARRGTPSDYLTHYVPALAAQLASAGLQPVDAVIRKGQALIWAANLAHGGAPVLRQGSTRRSQVTHYYFADCAYYTPMLSDEAAGRLALRVPEDLATGRLIWPTGVGLDLSLMRQFAGALVRRWLKRVYTA